MRPNSTDRDLPPRVLRRKKTFVSGQVWTAYYYIGRDAEGRRIEVPLGGDRNEFKRWWAELDCKPSASTGTDGWAPEFSSVP